MKKPTIWLLNDEPDERGKVDIFSDQARWRQGIENNLLYQDSLAYHFDDLMFSLLFVNSTDVIEEEIRLMEGSSLLFFYTFIYIIMGSFCQHQ